MFRIPYSIGSTLEYYKIELTRDELFTLSFDQIKELAREQRVIPDQHDPTKIDLEALQEWMNIAAAELPTFIPLDDHEHDFDLEMTPCIRSMILDPTAKGSRHETAFVLARYFKQCGIDHDTAITTLLNQPHWTDFNNEGREVTKVFKSVYHSPISQRIGCRGNSMSADTMRQLCSDWCHFSKNFIEMNIVDPKPRYNQ